MLSDIFLSDCILNSNITVYWQKNTRSSCLKGSEYSFCTEQKKSQCAVNIFPTPQGKFYLCNENDHISHRISIKNQRNDSEVPVNIFTRVSSCKKTNSLVQDVHNECSQYLNSGEYDFHNGALARGEAPGFFSNDMVLKKMKNKINEAFYTEISEMYPKC